MPELTCHRCGSDSLDVVEVPMDWDEVCCRDCGEFITTWGAASQDNQHSPLVHACFQTQQLARSMGISLAS
ncbi:hypothetical protein [Kushneria aurantia]|uniref:TFIIB-type domain-containing protein n=1 Tax=Kushneria aurantia TaxID=504092 RepID=A0ABV6G4P2_9GAMM|nr:hypothetical protein [Kushneria aurantia]